MSTAGTAHSRPTIDKFVTLLICELVLAGKRSICLRSPHDFEERQRMHALYRCLAEECDRPGDDKARLRFLLLLRNKLAPGLVGAFDTFRGLLMMQSFVSVGTNTFELRIGQTTARSMIDQADPFMRQLAYTAAKAYLA